MVRFQKMPDSSQQTNSLTITFKQRLLQSRAFLNRFQTHAFTHAPRSKGNNSSLKMFCKCAWLEIHVTINIAAFQKNTSQLRRTTRSHVHTKCSRDMITSQSTSEFNTEQFECMFCINRWNVFTKFLHA